MNIDKLKIFGIDIPQSLIGVIDHTQYGVDFDHYLSGLISLIMEGGSGREFCFERETTEVRAQIGRIIANEDFDDVATIIATRLLTTEQTVQERIAPMKKEIQKGIVVQALVSEEGMFDRFVICKAEHNEFLNEINFAKQRGLPIKKKVFKAVICYLNGTSVQNVLVYDSNSNLSPYWWKDFLELTKVHSDEDNTENAFDAITKNVIDKLKKDYPEDYMHLRNATVMYFRAKEDFEMNDYLDNHIGDYTPFDSKLNMNDLKDKIRKLPTTAKKQFDEKFSIVKKKIKARFLKRIELTSQIELHIKEAIPDIKNVIRAFEDDQGSKWVMIKSAEGYKYFDKVKNETTQ